MSEAEVKTEVKPTKLKGKPEQENKFWEKWFSNPEVLYLAQEKQREVILNPGKDEVWFEKVYPVKGKVILTRKVYISDLPRNARGKIIAVTADPINDKKFKAIKEKVIDYKQLSIMNVLKAKPQGTFYELFQSSDGGGTHWVNPSEYKNLGAKNNGKAKQGSSRKG